MILTQFQKRDKWILYKHTSNFELIKAVALDVKNNCGTNISEKERHRMQDRLSALKMYKPRNSNKPLDSINHRINTLEYFMFGYEDNSNGSKSKKFIFSPLGNLFLEHINEPEKLTKIFTTMLFGIQFQHPANNTPSCFQLYPFRLIFQLLTDKRLDYRLYNDEYVYFIAYQKTINRQSYEELVNSILEFRKQDKNEIVNILKIDEYNYVNPCYEWQYIQTLFEKIGIIDIFKGEELVKLTHRQRPNSTSKPTKRTLTTGYITLTEQVKPFIERMLSVYSCFQTPLQLNDPKRMRFDVIKEIYSFYPKILIEEISEVDDLQIKLLELPKLIKEYSKNPENRTARLFEDVLEDGFNLFYNVEAKKLGGAGQTDIECLYLTKNKKFAVEAKARHDKLKELSAGRLKSHREKIGGDYTIVITPYFVPAVELDIRDNPIVIILANTFSEYLYNHLYHDVRDLDFEDFDNIIINNLGYDISKLISDITIEKFGTKS